MSTDATSTSPVSGAAMRSPAPTPAPARKVTIREKVDREMRRGFLACVADLPRRPSEAFDDLARGKKHPWRYVVRRIEEARDARAERERVKRELIASISRAVDLLYEEHPPHAA